MKTTLLVTFICCCLIGCSATKVPSQEALNELKSLVEGKSFEFTANWANPMATQSMNAIANSGLLPPGSNASRINLIGNANFLKVMGDSVAANLPYFGERQLGGGYGTATGIEFNTKPSSYSERYDAEKYNYQIRFNANNNTEQYTVVLNIFASKSASVSITSSDRLSIRYDGVISSIEDKDKE